MKNVSVQSLVLLVVFIFSFLLTPAIFANKLTPTPDDIRFAKDFYQTFRNLMEYDGYIKFETGKIKHSESNISAFKPYLEKKLEYASKTLDLLSEMKTTTPFNDCSIELSKNLNVEIIHLKQALILCNKTLSKEEFDSLDATFNQINKRYEEIKENFISIVKQWDKQSIDEVENSYQQPNFTK